MLSILLGKNTTECVLDFIQNDTIVRKLSNISTSMRNAVDAIEKQNTAATAVQSASKQFRAVRASMLRGDVVSCIKMHKANVWQHVQCTRSAASDLMQILKDQNIAIQILTQRKIQPQMFSKVIACTIPSKMMLQTITTLTNSLNIFKDIRSILADPVREPNDVGQELTKVLQALNSEFSLRNSPPIVLKTSCTPDVLYSPVLQNNTVDKLGYSAETLHRCMRSIDNVKMQWEKFDNSLFAVPNKYENTTSRFRLVLRETANLYTTSDSCDQYNSELARVNRMHLVHAIAYEIILPTIVDLQMRLIDLTKTLLSENKSTQQTTRTDCVAHAFECYFSSSTQEECIRNAHVYVTDILQHYIIGKLKRMSRKLQSLTDMPENFLQSHVHGKCVPAFSVYRVSDMFRSLTTEMDAQLTSISIPENNETYAGVTISNIPTSKTLYAPDDLFRVNYQRSCHAKKLGFADTDAMRALRASVDDFINVGAAKMIQKLLDISSIASYTKSDPAPDTAGQIKRAQTLRHVDSLVRAFVDNLSMIEAMIDGISAAADKIVYPLYRG